MRQIQSQCEQLKITSALTDLIMAMLLGHHHSLVLLCIQELPAFGGLLYVPVLEHLAEAKPSRGDPMFMALGAMLTDDDTRLRSAWNPKPWRLLLKNYSRMGMSEAATNAFQEMRRRGTCYQEMAAEGLQPTRVTFNTLLKACMRAKDAARADEVLTWMQERSCQGDEFTYNTYIKAASYSGDVERALRVLPRMAASGVEPTPAVWGSLIVACGKAGQVESALGLWRQMAASGGPPPSVDNCNALLNACIDCGNGERALDIYRSMRDLGVEPDLVTYNLAMRACSGQPGSKLRADQLEQAFQLLAHMRAAGVEPCAQTITSLFALGARAGQGRRALALYQEVKDSGIRVDVALLSALIAALGSEGLAEEALTVFRRMVWGPRRMKPNEHTYRLITRICREAGLLTEALHAYRGMRRMGFRPSNAEWREMISVAVEAAMAERDGGDLAQQVAACLGLDEGQSWVDLHGLSSAEARAAVLCVLSSVQQRASAGAPLTSDLVFITGVGRHSDPEVGPVLHDAIHSLLNDKLKLETSTPRRRRRQRPNLSAAPDQHFSAGTDGARPTDRAHSAASDQDRPERRSVASSTAESSNVGGTAGASEAGDQSRNEGRGAERAGNKMEADSRRGRGASMADAGSLIIRKDTLADWLASRKGLLKSDLLR
ncbi:probable pentatricopeptide repeat-containing protein At2g31400, chloroplastic [Coccomyxa sp. Obi]|nr:probable pentatricopeptide repeat-containing protein At2g31400, chloroplastic [Coccomyxa sp. Obi]